MYASVHNGNNTTADGAPGLGEIVPVCVQGVPFPPKLVSVSDTVNVPVVKPPEAGTISIDVTVAPDFVVVVLPPLMTALVVPGSSVQE
jgi:hypothetical protein